MDDQVVGVGASELLHLGGEREGWECAEESGFSACFDERKSWGVSCTGGAAIGGC